MRLLESLREIEQEELHVFHMPGHKRYPAFIKRLENLIHLDITEIPKADHLHDPKDCILETQTAIEKLYGSYKSRVLINGSTVGILSMILGCVPEGSQILVNRNAHKSIYNAIEIGKLRPLYYTPRYDDYLGIVTSYEQAPILEMLKKYPEIKAIVLTYPTYEGLSYDITSVLEYCQEHGIFVLVDEAHGAHFNLSEQFPKSALSLGADIVIHSFHKTLPAMTQTACLHFGKRMEAYPDIVAYVDYYLKSLQTSSPSYPLMASVDAMLYLLADEGDILTQKLKQNIQTLYDAMSDLKSMSFVRMPNQDFTKLILKVTPEYYQSGLWDGEQLSKRLRAEFGIQVEYETNEMLLFMSSICSTKEDFLALSDALVKLDQERVSKSIDEGNVPKGHFNFSELYKDIISSEHQVLLPCEVRRRAYEEVYLEEAIGRISSDYIIPYPPGIPICIPGERISESTIVLAKHLNRHLMGDGAKVKVLKITEK